MKKDLPLSCVEISKGNLVHNIKQFRSLLGLNHSSKNGRPTSRAGLGKKTQIAGVVKANAYGHGDTQVVQILDSHVDYFQVNSIEEFSRIRKHTKKEILVLGYVGKGDLESAIKLKATLGVFDLEHALLINQIARKLNKKIKVHIAVDSHLGREGLMPESLEKALPEILKMKNITVVGVYSHFANIEDTNDFSHAQKQIDTYGEVVSIFNKYGLKDIQTHISATSGVLAYEMGSAKNSIVRLGIGLYGMWPSVELQNKWQDKIDLKPAIRWVSHIAQVKKLPKDHTIGYGLSYKTVRPMTVAVIPVGYSDGLTRSLSNIGEFIVGGVKTQILGRVAMNMVVVDVSEVPDVASGDEVVILGRQGDCDIRAEDLALKMDTINYEVTTHINPLLPRLIKG
ncbi:MAG: alanine racemase [Candidatus Pacebacteria bacterium]|nr:alanine racemase [Candidatus Paceibacterota bacterium]